MARRLTSHVTAIACALLGAATLCTADSLVDPTRPAGARAVSASRVARAAPLVSAILISEGRRVAVVDGKAVRTGDQLGDTHIDAIFDHGVRYTRDGVSAVSELPQQAAKVRSAPSTPVRLGER